MNRTRVLELALLLVITTACSAGSGHRAGTSFDGTWVMRLDDRPFMVLTLEPAGGGFTGSLARPLHMTSDGRSFSGITRETTTRRITSAAPTDGMLRLTAENPDDPSDRSEFEFRLTSPDAAGLKPADVPFDPWPFERHTAADPPQVWAGWDANRTYAVAEAYVPPNPDMTSIFEADQAVRQSVESFEKDAARIAGDDRARREQVRALLTAGALRAGEDFRRAAFIFQHGDSPDDFLLAHTLALVALAKGDRSASWIAAASLDRYLHAIDRPQIFGTGFTPKALDQEPFNRTLVSDDVRRQLGVPPLAEQREQMQKFLEAPPGTAARGPRGRTR